MSKLKVLLLSTGAMASALLGFGNSAHAVSLYGGGATLPQVVLRQAVDCYSNKVDLLFRTNGSNPPSVQTPQLADFNYVHTQNIFAGQDQNCATQNGPQPTLDINYLGTGSGRGVRAVFTHDSGYRPGATPDVAEFWGDTTQAAADPGGVNAIVAWPTVTFGMSDAALDQADVDIYNNGGIPTNTASPVCTGNPCTGLNIAAPGVAPVSGQYVNPNEYYGALVQIPALVAPVTIAYDPVYKKVRQGDGSIVEYKYNLLLPRADGSGGLRLNRNAFCGIFNGVGPNRQGNNWNVAYLKGLNGGVSLKDPADPDPAFNVTMQIGGRSDDSGTTELWTRHLAAVCSGLIGAGGIPIPQNYPDASVKLPAALAGGTYDKATGVIVGEVVGKYTRAAGNDGVAKYLDFSAEPGPNAGDTVVQGRIGYLGPDYVLPYVLNTGQNTYGLNTANVANQAGKYIAPTPYAVTKAYGAVLPPQSDPVTGLFDAGQPGDRTNPAALLGTNSWTQPPSKNAPIANPSGAAATFGYPIVGTSNFLAYTCYQTANSGYHLRNFLNWWYFKGITVDTTGVLAKAGFGALPYVWRAAIRDSFTNGTDGLGLRIVKNGDTASCSGLVGGVNKGA